MTRESTSSVEALILEISERSSAFVADASQAGAVKIAPAAALLRSVDLLKDLLLCARTGAAEAAALVLRTVAETTLHGHYVLVDGLDALQRMARAQADQIVRIGKGLGTAQDVLDAATEGLRELPGLGGLLQIAERVDAARGVTEDGQGLAQQTYAVLYAPLSNLVAHGGLGVLRDYVDDDGSKLRAVGDVPPLNSIDETLELAALLVGSLAMAVYRSFDLDTSQLVEIARRFRSD